MLLVGEKLLIPSVNGLVYTVTLGDTLSDLAAFYQVDVQSITSFAPNKLSSPDDVIEGMVLVLPGAVPPLVRAWSRSESTVRLVSVASQYRKKSSHDVPVWTSVSLPLRQSSLHSPLINQPPFPNPIRNPLSLGPAQGTSGPSTPASASTSAAITTASISTVSGDTAPRFPQRRAERSCSRRTRTMGTATT